MTHTITSVIPKIWIGWIIRTSALFLLFEVISSRLRAREHVYFFELYAFNINFYSWLLPYGLPSFIRLSASRKIAIITFSEPHLSIFLLSKYAQYKPTVSKQAENRYTYDRIEVAKCRKDGIYKVSYHDRCDDWDFNIRMCLC